MSGEEFIRKMICNSSADNRKIIPRFNDFYHNTIFMVFVNVFYLLWHQKMAYIGHFLVPTAFDILTFYCLSAMLSVLTSNHSFTDSTARKTSNGTAKTTVFD